MENKNENFLDYLDTFDTKNENIKKLIESIDNKGLVIFAGAGISKLCGLPLWNDFACQLLYKCYQDKLLSFFEMNDLKNTLSSDSKMLISIVFDKYKENKMETEFYKIFKDKLATPPKNVNKKKLVEAIKRLRASIITTNADGILDECVIKENIYYGEKLINCSKNPSVNFLNDCPKIFHIHGSVKQKETLVFTMEQYIDKYTNNEFKDALSFLLNSNNVPILFIGSSMSELELLQYILLRNNKNNPPRFILNGFYNHQSSMERLMRNYYIKYNITQISYSLDNKGYEGIIDFLNEFADCVFRSTSLLSDTYTEIADTIKDGVLKKIVQKMKLYMETLPCKHISKLFSEINNLKNGEKVYLQLFNNDKRYFNVKKIILSDDIQRTLFNSFSYLDVKNNKAYSTVANYYISNILKYIKKVDDEVEYYILYTFTHLLGKNYENNSIQMVEFIEYIIEKVPTYLESLVLELRYFSLHSKGVYDISTLLLNYCSNNYSDIRNFDFSEFFNKNLKSILDYSGYDFLLNVYKGIIKIIKNDELAYMDMGAIYDYYNSVDYVEFKHYLIRLLILGLQYIDPFEAKQFYEKLTNSSMDIKIKILICQIQFNDFSDCLIYDDHIFNVIDSVASLYYFILNNKERMTIDYINKIKIKINNASFGCENECDSLALRHKLITTLEGTSINKKFNSYYDKFKIENVGKRCWTSSIIDCSDLLDKVKEYDYEEFKSYFNNEINDSIYCEEILESYFSNNDAILKVLNDVDFLHSINKEYHFCVLKKITQKNSIDKIEILKFLDNVNVEMVNNWLILEIVNVNELYEFEPGHLYDILEKIFNLEMVFDYSAFNNENTGYAQFLINNNLFKITQLMVKCLINLNKYIEINNLYDINYENHVIVKLAIISMYKDLIEYCPWINEKIMEMINVYDIIHVAQLYSQMLFVPDINHFQFMNTIRFCEAYELIDKQFRHAYDVIILNNYLKVNEKILEYILKYVNVTDTIAFMYRNLLHFNSNNEKIIDIGYTALVGKLIDFNNYIKLLECFNYNSKNEKLIKLSSVTAKTDFRYINLVRLKPILLEMFDINQDYLFNDILSPIANRYIDKNYYDHEDRLYTLFENLKSKNPNSKNRKIIRELSLKAIAKGMMKFKVFARYK